MSDIFKTTLNYQTQQDTYAATGTGTVVNCSNQPVKDFSIEVKGTGAAATSWTVALEGSNDGMNWTTIVSHSNTDGDGVTKALANFPVLYFRSHCTALSLGSATNIVVTTLGMQ